MHDLFIGICGSETQIVNRAREGRVRGSYDPLPPKKLKLKSEIIL